MGAAYDAMCENESLEKRISSKNRQIREQKKLIIELAEGIVSNITDIHSSNSFVLLEKAEKVLVKFKKKK